MRRETWQESYAGLGATVDRLHEICDKRDERTKQLTEALEGVFELTYKLDILLSDMGYGSGYESFELNLSARELARKALGK
jgi:hypothetical protein